MSQKNKWQREANIIHQQYLCMPKEANQKEKKMTMLGKKKYIIFFFLFIVLCSKIQKYEKKKNSRII